MYTTNVIKLTHLKRIEQTNMGYYTRHELEIVKGDNDLIGALREVCEDAQYAINVSGDSENSCKWYSHEADLKSFSLRHPNAIFKLSGEGEESGDIWHEYYQNGKVQTCKAKIVFDDFNADLLK